MINVLYTCSASDISGYASASRSYITALAKHPHINLSVKSIHFETFKSDHSIYDPILKPLINKPIKADVQICQLTPENIPKYAKIDIPNVLYSVWECDRLPDSWVPLINKCQAVFVPSDYNVECFKNSGVKLPIEKVEHIVELDQFKSVAPLKLNIEASKYKFYNVGQYQPRKAQVDLLKAYFAEFTADEDVCMILKTYRQNHSDADRQSIEREIQAIKTLCNARSLPPIYIIHEALTREKMLGLHALGDCFVSPHMSEGWGLSISEAMASGKPVIATGASGNMEFQTAENSYLIDATETPVFAMQNPIYNIKQSWYQPSLGHLQKLMRHVYDNREEAAAKGIKAKEDMAKYNCDIIAEKIYQNLKKITGLE